MGMADGATGPPKRRDHRGPPEDGAATVCAKRDGGGKRLVAAWPIAYGEGVVREAPFLRVPRDGEAFLKSFGGGGLLGLAKRLGDSSRLAAFAAFCQLPEADQEELLAMGTSDGCTLFEETKKVIDVFLQDYPKLSGAMDWEKFCRIVAIINDRGSQLPNGDRVLYRLSSLAEHSWRPNAVAETHPESGVRELRVAAYAGLAENEGVTLSFVEEEALILPKQERAEAMRKMGRTWESGSDRSSQEGEVDLVSLFKSIAQSSIHTDSNKLADCEKDLASLDKALPFAMVGKARLRSKLGQAYEQCGLLSKAEELFEKSVDETCIVLGRKGYRNAENVSRRLEEIRDRMD